MIVSVFFSDKGFLAMSTTNNREESKIVLYYPKLESQATRRVIYKYLVQSVHGSHGVLK